MLSGGVGTKIVLGQSLSHSVKELQRQYAAQPKGYVLTSSSETANELCTVLEAVFLHDLKTSLSAKVSSSLAKLDVRRRNTGNVSSLTFWPLLVACSPKDVVSQLSRLAHVTSEIGQCRAWIRMALNEGLMENYLEAMLGDKSLISSTYKETAFLLDPELTFSTKSLLQGLMVLSFNLTYDSQDLNTWPSDSLQLAGIEDPSRQSKVESTVDQSDVPVYDPMASFSTLGTALKTRETSDEKQRDKDQSRPRKLKSKGSQRKRGRTTVLPPSTVSEEKEEVIETRRSKSMLATSLTQKENRDSSDGEELVKPSIRETGEKGPWNPSTSGETNISHMVSLPIDSAEQLSSEERLSHLDSHPVSVVVDIPRASRALNDSILVPPHLDTSETSIVGTPADSFGYLLKKHRRRGSQPGIHMANVDSQASHLEDYGGLSYDMVTPSRPSHTTDTLPERKVEDTQNAELMGYEVIQSSPSLSPSPSQLFQAGESRHSLLTHISREQGLDSQSFQCRDCSAPIGMIFGRAKVCTFNARYYCQECHKDEEVLIPARIIHNWDFTKHAVSHSSREYINSIEEEPLFNLAKINSSLYDHVPELQEAKMLRQQLSALVPYVYTCQTRVWEDFRKKVWGKEYMFENEDLYSIADFVNVQSRQLMSYLKKTVSSAMKHVHRCKVCCQKGFICEICNNPKIIYPFEVHSTLQCRTCQSVFHKSCKLSAACPKCARLNERRRRRQQEEVIDQPSPPLDIAGDQ